MCPQCRLSNQREVIGTLQEFYARCRDLDDLLRQGVFTIVSGHEEWPEMMWQAMGNGIRTYLGDVALFQFQCSHCHSVFNLEANFYRGPGSWGLADDKSLTLV